MSRCRCKDLDANIGDLAGILNDMESALGAWMCQTMCLPGCRGLDVLYFVLVVRLDSAARELSTQVLQSAPVLTTLNSMVAELDVYVALPLGRSVGRGLVVLRVNSLFVGACGISDVDPDIWRWHAWQSHTAMCARIW